MLNINFTPFPNIKTERLNLRQLSVEEARQFINKINNGIKNNENIYWAISSMENQKLIGTICLWQISVAESKAEIGFELLPEYQGKGIIQEAVKNVLDYGFNHMKLSAIEGEVAPGNIKSIKVMERFNFKKVNEIRDNDPDDVKEGRTIIYRLEI